MKKFFVALLLAVTCLTYAPVSYAQPSFDAQMCWNAGQRTCDSDGNGTNDINLNSSGLACTGDCMQLTDSFSLWWYPSALYGIQSIAYKASPCTCGSSIRCEGQYLDDTLRKRRFYRYVRKPVRYDQPWANTNGLNWQIKTATDPHPSVAMLELYNVSTGKTDEWLQLYADTVHANGSNQVQTLFKIGEMHPDSAIAYTFDIDLQPNYTGYLKLYRFDSLIYEYHGPTCNKFYNPAQPGYDLSRLGEYPYGLCPPDAGDNTTYRKMIYWLWKVGSTGVINDWLLKKPTAPVTPPVTPTPTTTTYLIGNWQAVKVN